MSLEQQIASLVEASNNLTGAVNGKISEIDQKVTETLNVVPSKIRAELSRIVYVNATSGNDTNDGLVASRPKKTIKNAIDTTPVGGMVEIRLSQTDEHIISSLTDLTGKIVVLVGHGADYRDPSTYVKVKPSYGINGVGQCQSGQLRIGREGFIYAIMVSFDTVELGADAVGQSQPSYLMSIFSSASSSGKIVLEHCEINLKNGSLSHQHTTGSFGYLDLLMRNVRIHKIDMTGSVVTAARQYLIDSYNSSPIPFDLYGVEMMLTGATNYAELVAADTTNIRSNLI